ncbi:MAG: hypothetical protein ACOX6T_19400 [Myxococcales bacterium]|jgi:hypothetical protein
MKHLKSLIASVAVVMVAAGCPDEPREEPRPPLDEPAVRQTANANVAEHLDSIASMLLTYEDSSLVGAVFPAAGEACIGDECPEPTEGADLDWRADVEEIKQWLADHVFTEANVESVDADRVVYRLGVTSMCPEEPGEGGAPAERDPDCVKLFTDRAIRLVVTVPAEGDLDIEVQVDDARPLIVRLHASEIAVVLDLAVIKTSVNAIAATLGETVEMPSTFAGRVELSLARLSANEYRGVFSVLQAVEVVHKPASDPEHVAFALAAVTDAVSITLDAAQRRALASVALGAFDFEAALDLIDPRCEEVRCTADTTGGESCETVPADPRSGVLALHPAGLSGQAQLSVEQDELTVTNLSLGNQASTVKYNGSQILAADLNASAGRKLDLTIRDSADGLIVKVKPSFELVVAHALGVLRGEYPDLAGWLDSGSTGIKLDGATEPSVKFLESVDDVPCPAEGPCEEPPPNKLLEVLAGTLTLTATDISNVVVGAGSCLVESEPEPEPEPEFGTGSEPDTEPEPGEVSHPWLDLVAGSCQ